MGDFIASYRERVEPALGDFGDLGQESVARTSPARSAPSCVNMEDRVSEIERDAGVATPFEGR